MKEKLDSAEADARAHADDAARSAREEAEKQERAAAQRLGAVANSLAGSLKQPILLFLVVLLFFSKFLLLSHPGYLVAPAGSSSQASSEYLEGALVALEGIGGQTGSLLSKAKDALTHLHGSVFPKAQAPSSFSELAKLFGLIASTIAEFHYKKYAT